MPSNELLKSVWHTLDVLELVGSSSNGVLSHNLGKMLNQKGPALRAMLRTMTKRGFLVKLENPPRYILGSRSKTFDCASQVELLIRRASPIMMAIARQAHMQVLFQRQTATSNIVLRRVQPETPLFLETTDWYGCPYGTGIIFQAYQSTEEQDYFWRCNPMDELAKTIWGNHENLCRFLRGVPTWRLAVISHRFDGKIRMSAPILDADGKPFAAVSCIQSVKNLKQQDIVLGTRLLYQTGRMLSADFTPDVRLMHPAGSDAVFGKE